MNRPQNSSSSDLSPPSGQKIKPKPVGPGYIIERGSEGKAARPFQERRAPGSREISARVQSSG